MREAVEERGGELLVAAEDLGPLREREVRGDQYGPALVARRDRVEQQLAANAVERDEPDLVKEEHVDAIDAALEPPELALVARLDEIRTRSAARKKATRRRCRAASMPRAIAR